MSCKDENKKRKTYQNQLRLAKVSKRISGADYTVYKTEENLFEFCKKADYRPDKGTKIIDV